jgi:hypothetical protein
MRKLTLVIPLAVLCALVHAPPAIAETDGDARVAQIHQEHPQLGFLLFDVSVLRDGQLQCRPYTATLTSNTGKRVSVDVFTPMLSLHGESRGALASLEPAVWTIAMVNCHKHIFNGPFAQTRIESGEIINAGNLVVDVYTIRPEGLFNGPVRGAHTRVEDLGPETVESLQKRAPGTFAKAKRRYFGINPAVK